MHLDKTLENLNKFSSCLPPFIILSKQNKNITHIYSPPPSLQKQPPKQDEGFSSHSLPS